MGDRAADEGPVEAGLDSEVVGVLDREPAPLQPEEVDGEESSEEGGKRAERDQRRRDEVVDEAASPPGGDHPEGGAEDEGEHEADADERDGVGERPRDDFGDGRREVRGRDAEVTAEDLLEVVPVRLEERLLLHVQVLAQVVDHVRVRGELRRRHPRHQPVERRAGHQARQQEIEGDRAPEGNRVEAEATENEAHGRIVSLKWPLGGVEGPAQQPLEGITRWGSSVPRRRCRCGSA